MILLADSLQRGKKPLSCQQPGLLGSTPAVAARVEIDVFQLRRRPEAIFLFSEGSKNLPKQTVRRILYRTSYAKATAVQQKPIGKLVEKHLLFSPSKSL